MACSGSEKTNTDGRECLQMAPLTEDLYQDIQRTSKLKKNRIHFLSGQETGADTTLPTMMYRRK